MMEPLRLSMFFMNYQNNDFIYKTVIFFDCFFYFYKKCGKTLEKALQKCDELSIKVLQKGELYVKEKN